MNEEKKLKDYLPFYLGSEVIGTNVDEIKTNGILTGISSNAYDCEIQFFNENHYALDEEPFYNSINDIKLILRPLSDITIEEKTNVVDPITYGLQLGLKENICLQAALLTQYLLSKHFDLFGLIDAGLAIDATK